MSFLHRLAVACATSAFLATAPFPAALAPSSRALAQDAFPSAASILEEAKLGRVEFLRAIGRVEASLEFLPDKATAISYLRIVDELEVQADRHGFSDLGGDPLYRLKQGLSIALLKWINVRDDAQDDLAAFALVSTDDTMWRFIEAQSPYFGEARSDLARFEALYRKFAALAAVVEESPVFGTGVKASFRNTQSQYLEFILRSKASTVAELRAYYRDVKGEAGFAAISNSLLQASSRASDPAALKQILDFAFEILADLGKVDFFVPSYLRDMPNRSIIAAVDKIILQGGSLDVAYVERLFSTLENRQIEELLYLVRRAPIENVRPGQSAFMSAMAVRGLRYYEDFGLARDAMEMREYVARVKLLDIMRPGVDGLYTATLDGVKYDISVLRAGVAELVVVFGSEVVSYSMVHSFFDLATGEVVLSRHYQDVIGGVPNTGLNSTFRIKALGGGTLKGVFDNGRKTYNVSAARVSNPYKNYIGLAPVARESVTGVYSGAVSDAFFNGAELRLNETGRVVTGTITLKNAGGTPVSMGFTDGSLLSQSNVVSLISSETPRGNIVHVRGQVTGGVFRGQYIPTGTKKVIALTLRKVR